MIGGFGSREGSSSQEEETPYKSEAHRHIKRVRRPRREPKKQRAHQIGKKGKKF